MQGQEQGAKVRIAMTENYGLKHIYTGNGKGKTTAAIGAAIRAIGQNKRVIFAQFMKGRKSGERRILADMPGITTYFIPEDFGFYFRMTEEDKRAITRWHNSFLNKIEEAIREDACDMVIMDEVVYAYAYGLMDVEQFQRIYFGKSRVELILTGRTQDEALLQEADYITEMQAVRHPYEKGVTARKGIEY